MTTALDLPTHGKILRVEGDQIIFRPRHSNYELHLFGSNSAESNKPIQAVVRAKARKVYTVPSGGNFTVPIQGPPRIVQGWVLYADDRNLIVHAGANFNIELPASDTAIDLDEGAIAVNKMVNVTLFPGATFELAEAEPQS
jgi:hypothetical protein